MTTNEQSVATDAQYAAYVFACDGDIAQLAEAQRMRAAFLNQSRHCGFCLFQRDLYSAPLNAQGQCPICERLGQ